MRQTKGTQPPHTEAILPVQEESDSQTDTNIQSTNETVNDQAEKDKDLKKTPMKDNNSPNGKANEDENIIREGDLLNVVSELLESKDVKERRPLPVYIRGKQVDLLKLCIQVRASGGYNKVTMWSLISKNLGFGSECGPILKLLYMKYLKPLEHRRLVTGRSSQNQNGIVHTMNEEDKDDVEPLKSVSKSKKRKLLETDELPVVDSTLTEQIALSHEDNESFAKMLKWVKSVALDLGIPKRSHASRVMKNKEQSAEKWETLATKVRAVLWKNLAVLSANDPVTQTLVLKTATQGLNSRKRGRIKNTEEKASTKKT